MQNNTDQDQTTATLEEYKDCFGETNEVMKRLLLCTLCGGHLHFNHMTDFRNNMVQETARAPEVVWE